MSKKSLIKSINIVENDGMKYAVVYEVRGCRENQSANNIGFYFSKEKAEETKDIYYKAEIYDVVYIVEKMVWF